MSPILPQPSGSTHTSKRAQPLPRRSTLVRKRDDSSSDYIPSSPTKKVKVTFDNDVEVRTVGQFEKAPELIQQEVRSAFQKRAHGTTPLTFPHTPKAGEINHAFLIL